jgi:hypothetical protein
MLKGILSVEKRKFPRIPLDATVRFRRLSNQKEKDAARANFVEARSKDLSQGGVALVQTAELKTGDLLKIEIQIPGREGAIKAFSEVMWIKPPGSEAKLEVAGIKFMGLKQDDEDYLSNLISEAVEEGSELDGEAARLSETEFIRKMGKRFAKD